MNTARAIGIPDSPEGIPSAFVESTMKDAAALFAIPEINHLPSMLLDVMKERPIEVEVILGEVVRMARERGVPVPVSPAISCFGFHAYEADV